jgi:hypothetical protein
MVSKRFCQLFQLAMVAQWGEIFFDSVAVFIVAISGSTV